MRIVTRKILSQCLFTNEGSIAMTGRSEKAALFEQNIGDGRRRKGSRWGSRLLLKFVVGTTECVVVTMSGTRRGRVRDSGRTGTRSEYRGAGRMAQSGRHMEIFFIG